jgi:hypothetical protein
MMNIIIPEIRRKYLTGSVTNGTVITSGIKKIPVFLLNKLKLCL